MALPAPYYQDESVTLYHADCRDVLPEMAAGSVDLVLTDPDYGETSLAWDVRVKGWLRLVRPLLSPAGSLWCFGSLRFFLEEVAEFADWRHAQEIVWEKHNGSGFHTDRFRRVHELILHYYPKDVRWADVYKEPQFANDATARTIRRKALPPAWQGARGPSVYESHDGGPRLMRSVQSVRTCHGRAIHPTQKPEGIVRPPLLYSCPPGGLVLDPFAGSGTTLVVARQEGRRAIGIEKDAAHCRAAAARLAQAVLPLAV